MNQTLSQFAEKLKTPSFPSSYHSEDVVMVFTEIIEKMEIETKEKERLIQSGVHYSEMLPTESIPEIPLETFKKLISNEDMMEQLAYEIGILGEKIRNAQRAAGNEEFVLVSLARAGTPVGILVKRYFKKMHNLNIPHYSISILRDKGLDFNALAYIVNKEGHDSIQFVDGWTGKGVIQKTLTDSVHEFNRKFDTNLNSQLACLYDPALITPLCATHEDRLLPSAIYNSTVSGLMSRTIQRDDLLSANDYHGSKVYRHLKEYDVSEIFLDEVEKNFRTVTNTPHTSSEELTGTGWDEVQAIKNEFGYLNINNVKPSVGETTRVLIRRYPERVLVKDLNDPDISFILALANQKGVPVQEYPTLSHYKAVGMIKEIKE